MNASATSKSPDTMPSSIARPVSAGYGDACGGPHDTSHNAEPHPQTPRMYGIAHQPPPRATQFRVRPAQTPPKSGVGGYQRAADAASMFASMFGRAKAPGTVAAMPDSEPSSTRASVRAAGLVLTLVATAAGAAGAATLSPDPSAADVETRPKLTTSAVPDDPQHEELAARAASSRRHVANERAKQEAEAAARAAAVRVQAAAAHAEALRVQQAEASSRRVAMWDRLAACETGGDWQNGGDYGGGLGIYVGTWHAYGGREFAARPQYASKAQQIIVAERIARGRLRRLGLRRRSGAELVQSPRASANGCTCWRACCSASRKTSMISSPTSSSRSSNASRSAATRCRCSSSSSRTSSFACSSKTSTACATLVVAEHLADDPLRDRTGSRSLRTTRANPPCRTSRPSSPRRVSRVARSPAGPVPASPKNSSSAVMPPNAIFIERDELGTRLGPALFLVGVREQTERVASLDDREHFELAVVTDEVRDDRVAGFVRRDACASLLPSTRPAA